MASANTTMLTDDEVALLREPVLAHLATVMPDGSPQVTPVWVDTDGEAILMNTAKGRVKHRNIQRDPRVAVSLSARDDNYRIVVVRGRAELVDQGAEEHIDRLAKKYLGQDRYPMRQPGMVRVTIRVVPEHVIRRR
jgi:PPOX class probable F420-dependent enzyme